MPIEFRCQICNKLLRTSDERAGQTAQCPDCGATVSVPGGGGVGSDYGNLDGSSTGFKRCPLCGEQIQDVAVKCRHCGEFIGGATGASQRSQLPAHRGGLILAFGILSWAVCIIFGAIAWSMGNTDLAEMDAGRMDPEGRSMTQAGKIIGMVHCIVFIVALAAGVLFLIAVGLAAAL